MSVTGQISWRPGQLMAPGRNLEALGKNTEDPPEPAGESPGREVRVTPVELRRVLGSPEAVSVLRWLAARRRHRIAAAGTDGEPDVVERFTYCEPVDAEELRAEISDPRLQALVDCGAAVVIDGWAVALLSLRYLRGVAIAYPQAQRPDGNEVYLGTGGFWLMQLAFRYGSPGDTAADLATGTGLVAVALSARYDRVVAVDLLPEAVRTARLTLDINASQITSTGAAVMDVAAGLRDGVFDLVVANPPWVPDAIGTDGENQTVYAAGGPTGMELPARFIEEAGRLLAPGGTAIILVLDGTWDGGRRPLDEQCDLLRDRGFEIVDVVPAPPAVWGEAATKRLTEYAPNCTAGSVVALVFRRPC